MLTRNPEGQEELITQLWQKTICKLYEIQCSIRNKYVTKKKEKLLGLTFLIIVGAQMEICPKTNSCHLSQHDICHTAAPDCCNRIKELQLLCLEEQMYFMDTP